MKTFIKDLPRIAGITLMMFAMVASAGTFFSFIVKFLVGGCCAWTYMTFLLTTIVIALVQL